MNGPKATSALSQFDSQLPTLVGAARRSHSCHNGHGLGANQSPCPALETRFKAARPSCGPAVCIAHDGEPGGSEREHDAWRRS